MLDNRTETYESYSVEQQERKRQFEEQFKSDVNKKVDGWNGILAKHKASEKLSKEDIAFMIDEIGISYDSSVSNAIPYLQGHTTGLKEKHIDSNGIEVFVEVVSHYFDAMAFIFGKELAVFGRKKVIDSCIDKARETLKATEEKAQELELFLQGQVNYMESWEKNKRRWEIVDHQQMINRPFVPKEIEWMIDHSEWSIREQVETGRLFFSHHFDQLERKEYFRKRLENFSKVFHLYKKALETVATEPIPLLDTGQHLERMKNHLRKAKQECVSEHHEVKEYLRKAKQEKDLDDDVK